jgi:hypothetical protein
MRRPRRQTKSSNFRITGYVDGREYSGLRGRKNYYNKPSDMQRIPTRGTNGKPIWLKFLDKGIVEDCPHCNPDILMMYRLNPENDDYVETNFDMTMEVQPIRRKINYRKNKNNKYRTCHQHPRYDHHHHKMNTIKGPDKGAKYLSMTPEKMHTFVEKYGKSINRKMKFKKSPSNTSLMSGRSRTKSRSLLRKDPKQKSSYSKMYGTKGKKRFN